MTTIHISAQLADKLNRLAEREHKTVDEMVETMLEREILRRNLPDKPRPGSSAALLKSALEAHIHSNYTDTAERSREILDNEFADYLRNRMHEDNDPTP